MLKFDYKNLDKKIDVHSVIKKYQKDVNKIIKDMNEGRGAGSHMLGWRNIDKLYPPREIKRIKECVNKWKKAGIKDLIIIAIGGSFVGTKAAINMVNGLYGDPINIYFINNMSSNYMLQIANKLNKSQKKFGIICVSKSGTTLEPAIGFRIFRELLINNIGKDKSREFIICITDGSKGTLYNYAKAKGYTMFSVPDDIGGRFSTLSPVGIVPMAFAGLDIEKILQGAKKALTDLNTSDLYENSAYLYAVLRHYFYKNKNFPMEMILVYEPQLQMLAYQSQQLFAESEGKGHSSLYPVYAVLSTDLHSVGQYLQEGPRNFFETTIMIEKPQYDMKIKIDNNDDGLKYLNNKNLYDLTKKAFEGTVYAHHVDGGINNLIVTLSKADEYHYGYWFIWNSLAAVLSAYLLKHNPFDQPGVENYKKQMFSLLGKK